MISLLIVVYFLFNFSALLIYKFNVNKPISSVLEFCWSGLLILFGTIAITITLIDFIAYIIIQDLFKQENNV